MRFSLYVLTCTVNQRRYVGITSGSPTHRFSQHVHDAGKGSPNPLHRAIRKYGVEAFTLEVVARRDSAAEIAELEREYIQVQGCHVRLGGYNVATGGQGPFGVTRSAETRAKVSAGLKRFYAEHPMGRQVIEVMRERERVRLQNPAEREKSRQGATRAWLRPGYRERVVGAIRSRTQDPAARQRMRQVKLEQKPRSAKAVTVEGTQYRSIGDAVRALQIPHNTLVQRIRSPNFGGYSFASS